MSSLSVPSYKKAINPRRRNQLTQELKGRLYLPEFWGLQLKGFSICYSSALTHTDVKSQCHLVMRKKHKIDGRNVPDLAQMIRLFPNAPGNYKEQVPSKNLKFKLIHCTQIIFLIMTLIINQVCLSIMSTIDPHFSCIKHFSV